jgi:tetratricopeptide (TPR) repeat protein
VEAQQISGEQGSYGVVFRIDGADNRYYFDISNSQFSVYLMYNNNWTPLIEWTWVSAIRPNESNRLTVSAQGSHFTFFINDLFVGEADNDRLSYGRVGLAVELYNAGDEAVFEFDNFEINLFDTEFLIMAGERYARQGNIDEAIASFTEAQVLDPSLEIPAVSWNTLCWFGGLWGYAADVIDACERAVELAPESGAFLDSRGLAKALLGDYSGAIEDFRIFVEWTKQNGTYEVYGQQREAWITELEEGRNPFDEATLSALREE